MIALALQALENFGLYDFRDGLIALAAVLGLTGPILLLRDLSLDSRRIQRHFQPLPVVSCW